MTGTMHRVGIAGRVEVKRVKRLLVLLILVTLCGCVSADTSKRVYSAKVRSLAVPTQHIFSFFILFRNNGDEPITFNGIKKKRSFELVQPYVVPQEKLMEWKDIVFTLGSYLEPPDRVVVNPHKEIVLTADVPSAIFKDRSQVYRLHFCSNGHRCLYYTSPFKIDDSMHPQEVK